MKITNIKFVAFRSIRESLTENRLYRMVCH